MYYFLKIGSSKNASNFVVYITKFIWFNPGGTVLYPGVSWAHRYYVKAWFIYTKIILWDPLTPICRNWVPGDPRTIFLVTSFTRKMPESSDSMYFSIFMLENIWYHHFTRSEPNSQEIVNFILKYGSRGNQNKLEQNSQFLVNSVHFR